MIFIQHNCIILKLAEDATTTANLSEKCLTFIDLNGQLTCNPDNIQSLLKNVDAEYFITFFYQIQRKIKTKNLFLNKN